MESQFVLTFKSSNHRLQIIKPSIRSNYSETKLNEWEKDNLVDSASHRSRVGQTSRSTRRLFSELCDSLSFVSDILLSSSTANNNAKDEKTEKRKRKEILSLSGATPPFDELLKIWDYHIAFGLHLNVITTVARLVLIRDTLLSTAKPFDHLNHMKIPNLDSSLMIPVCPSSFFHDHNQTSIIKHQTSDIKHQTSDIKHRTPNQIESRIKTKRLKRGDEKLSLQLSNQVPQHMMEALQRHAWDPTFSIQRDLPEAQRFTLSAWSNAKKPKEKERKVCWFDSNRVIKSKERVRKWKKVRREEWDQERLRSWTTYSG